MTRRRRSILGDLCMQLALQAAFAVSAINAVQAADDLYARNAILNDDAFVFTGPGIAAVAATPPSFEEFSLAFYLPPEPEPTRYEYVPLPDLDAALLGGPERSYALMTDDFLFN